MASDENSQQDAVIWLTYDEIASICGVTREEVQAMFASDMWGWITGTLAISLPVAEVPLYLTSATEWTIPLPAEEKGPA